MMRRPPSSIRALGCPPIRVLPPPAWMTPVTVIRCAIRELSSEAPESSLFAWSALSWYPRLVGVVGFHRIRQLRRLGPEILLIHDAVLVDDEGHNPRGAVARGICDEREAPDHVSLYDEVVSAAGCVGALREEDPIEVAVIGDRAAAR